MSLIVLLNPKQYPITPYIQALNDVWYPEPKKRRKKKEIKSVETLLKHLNAEEIEDEVKKPTVKRALSELREKGYRNVQKYNKKIIDQLLLIILENYD
jgi:hypothetical protein